MPSPTDAVDILDVYADRAKFLAQKPKKKSLKKDFGDFMWQLKNLPDNLISKREFTILLKKFKSRQIKKKFKTQYMNAYVVRLGLNWIEETLTEHIVKTIHSMDAFFTPMQ